MKIGYARVSTISQLEGNSLEEQENELKVEGCEVVYRERYTGSKINRPIFNKIIEKLQQGNTLVVTKLDRFARSTTEGIEIINKLMKKGIRYIF